MSELEQSQNPQTVEDALHTCHAAVAKAATAVAELTAAVEQLCAVLPKEPQHKVIPTTPTTPPLSPAVKPWIWPVAGIAPRITQHFDVPVTYANGKHEGVDLDVYDDTTGKLCPIVSVADGTITHINRWNKTTAGWQSYGNYVEICNDDGYSVMYCHLSEIAAGLIEHQRVTQGQVIGVGGNTGNSRGAHLHLTATHPDAPPVYVFNQRCVNPEMLLPKP